MLNDTAKRKRKHEHCKEMLNEEGEDCSDIS